MFGKVYDYQKALAVPYFFDVDFASWSNSFRDDMDGEGRKLFKTLETKVKYENETVVGFVQYGRTAFGFDEHGEISDAVSYPVIRQLYFDKEKKEVGAELLEAALEDLNESGKVYAFFHYFGMSCFARHGKLFEKLPWVEAVLKEQGFVVEHENVYYSFAFDSQETYDAQENEIKLVWHDESKGNHQVCDFMLEAQQIGGCEVHYVSETVAYLRWIYLNDDVQNKGLGSRCMNRLKFELKEKGCTRFDTDTALNNDRAQHYYEKNGFVREGITRSYER